MSDPKNFAPPRGIRQVSFRCRRGQVLAAAFAAVLVVGVDLGVASCDSTTTSVEHSTVRSDTGSNPAGSNPGGSDPGGSAGQMARTNGVAGEMNAGTSGAAASSDHSVTYGCSGSAPKGVDITYGPQGSQSKTDTLPFTMTTPLDSSRTNAGTSAQVHGSGSVSCTTTVKRSGDSNGARIVSNSSVTAGD
jgi:hypothetical protein